MSKLETKQTKNTLWGGKMSSTTKIFTTMMITLVVLWAGILFIAATKHNISVERTYLIQDVNGDTVAVEVEATPKEVRRLKEKGWWE